MFYLYMDRGSSVLNPMRSKYLWMLLISLLRYTIVLRAWFCTSFAVCHSKEAMLPCYSWSFLPLALVWWIAKLRMFHQSLNPAAYWENMVLFIWLCYGSRRALQSPVALWIGDPAKSFNLSTILCAVLQKLLAIECLLYSQQVNKLCH